MTDDSTPTTPSNEDGPRVPTPGFAPFPPQPSHVPPWPPVHTASPPHPAPVAWPAPAPAPSARRRVRWALAVVVIVAVLTGIGFSSAGSSGSSAMTPGTPSAEPSDGSTDASPNTDAELAAWATENEYLLDDFIDIQDDLEYAATDPVDIDGVYWAASDLSDWVDEARMAGPMPDATVDGHWQNALDHYEAAADSLMYSVENFDVDALGDYSNSMDMANDEIEMAIAVLDQR